MTRARGAEPHAHRWLAGHRKRRQGGQSWPTRADPREFFGVLGLDREAELTDHDVRTAWRQVASRTHPDRDDGGDPDRFADAAAAYSVLRTAAGRQQARASSSAQRRPARTGITLPGLMSISRQLARGSGRRARGRPFRIALRLVIAGAAVAAALLAAGSGPTGLALVAGAITWVVLAIRRDLLWRSPW
jgi:DnaJ domain